MSDDVVNGSIDTLNTLQVGRGHEALDTSVKNLMVNPEFLAVIMQCVIPEYKGFSKEKIMGFIEKDSVSVNEVDVTAGRTNTKVEGSNTEFKIMNEKTSDFDILFKAINPVLTDFKAQPVITVHLHIDIEPQKNYRPGYPIEKRGVYYLARAISSQLGTITEKTDYGVLEKCYSIWICRDNIPAKEVGTVSRYAFTNTDNYGIQEAPNKDYDLMEMIIIRLGEKKNNTGKNSDENNNTDNDNDKDNDKDSVLSVVRFLNSFFFPKEADKMIKELGEFVDFSKNLALLQEVENMSGLGQSFYDEGKTEGKKEGKTEEFLKNVRNLMESFQLGIAEACRALGHSEEDYRKALSALKQ